ncbi:MAG: Asp-tRNA(Asn)/Glu-tRNA(Gln) amidotransferase subunit GatC [Saprospiraceae bacterium]|nr:Asp-tRNA(Asn)/Glu-tRNA(Gln) amidotransferase subunit GatC [Saprospiraceae bacterium]
MEIDNQLILKLSRLARLDLSDEEREKLQKDLGDILQMVEKLQELDTDEVEPLVYLTEPPERAEREDVIEGQVQREEALRSAPDRDKRFFRLPKVIDSSDNESS